MASRAQLVSEVIRPSRNANRIVITDRYLLANVVYQGHAGGLDPEQLWQAGTLSTGGIEPDLTLVLHLPVETAAAPRARPPDPVESRGPNYLPRAPTAFLPQTHPPPTPLSAI